MTRIVFAGTPEFARESLQALVDSGHVPVAVLTQPDRPAGRGKKLTASPVKKYAEPRRLEVLQPETLGDDEIVDALRSYDADLFVVAAYGLLLPQRVLDIPRTACINVHASLLPRWRGAAPIQMAILAGDEKTGVCLMRMEAGLDTGPVYSELPAEISATESAGELHDRLATMGGDLLVQHIDDIASGTLQPTPQDESLATYAPKITTADARIDWRRDAASLHRHVRAYNPVPGAWTMLGDERLKCWSAMRLEGAGGVPGTVLSAGADGIDVATGDGVLRLCEVQRPGKGRVAAAEFAVQLSPVGCVLD